MTFSFSPSGVAGSRASYAISPASVLRTREGAGPDAKVQQ